MRIPTLPAALIAALLLGSTAIAQADTAAVDQTAVTPVVAQATPNPSATPAGTRNPGPSSPSTPAGPQSPSGGPTQTRATPAPPRPVSHLPILDFVVTFTQPAYYRNSVQILNYDPLDVGGTVRIPVTRKLNLVFDRVTEGTLNQPLEQALNPANGAPILSAASRDILLQYHATYAFDRYVTMDVGESFRHRVYAYRVVTGGTPAAPTFTPAFNLTNISARPFPDTLSSTEHHFVYAGLSYTTKPWRDLWNSQFSLAETVDVQKVDHHVAIACTAAMISTNLNQCGGRLVNQVGYLDERPGTSSYTETTQGITWILPVDPRHGTSFTLNERWGYLNFYENQPFPFRWDSALTYQLNKRFSPGFTLALRHSDFHAAEQGAPFPTPNAIHVGSWDVIGTFHVDTNSWFH